MRALLDTHVLLQWILEDRALSPAAVEFISDRDNIILVSAASAWELAIKFETGKVPTAADLVAAFSSVIEEEGFHQLHISVEHGIRAGLLPMHHKDPFDRMLIAQAQAESIPIVSSDTIFDSYGVRRLW